MGIVGSYIMLYITESIGSYIMLYITESKSKINELSSMVVFSPERLFCGMHRFTISTCESVPNLITIEKSN